MRHHLFVIDAEALPIRATVYPSELLALDEPDEPDELSEELELLDELVEEPELLEELSDERSEELELPELV